MAEIQMYKLLISCCMLGFYAYYTLVCTIFV